MNHSTIELSLKEKNEREILKLEVRRNETQQNFQEKLDI